MTKSYRGCPGNRNPCCQAKSSFVWVSGIRDSGRVVAYGVNFVELCRRAAYFVDRILKGAHPGDLPVEQPTKFGLAVNLKTAKTLRIAISPTLLARADEVIE